MQAVINSAITVNYGNVFPLLSVLRQIFIAVWLKSRLAFLSVLWVWDEIKLTDNERERIDADGCCGKRTVKEMECIGMSQWIRIKWKSISAVVIHLARVEFKWMKALITWLNPHCVLPTDMHVLFWWGLAKRIIHNNQPVTLIAIVLPSASEEVNLSTLPHWAGFNKLLHVQINQMWQKFLEDVQTWEQRYYFMC